MKDIAPILVGSVKSRSTFSTCPSWSGSQVSFLLFCVNVPYNVIGQPHDLIACPLGHFGEPFCFCLILKRVARKVDACQYVSLGIKAPDVFFCVPDLCTSAFTRILTPPMPSSSTSSSLLFRQSPIWTRYFLFVSYSLYPIYCE